MAQLLVPCIADTKPQNTTAQKQLRSTEMKANREVRSSCRSVNECKLPHVGLWPQNYEQRVNSTKHRSEYRATTEDKATRTHYRENVRRAALASSSTLRNPSPSSKTQRNKIKSWKGAPKLCAVDQCGTFAKTGQRHTTSSVRTAKTQENMTSIG